MNSTCLVLYLENYFVFHFCSYKNIIYALILLPSYRRESTKIFIEFCVNNSCCHVTISGTVVLSVETIAPGTDLEWSGQAWWGVQNHFFHEDGCDFAAFQCLLREYIDNQCSYNLYYFLCHCLDVCHSFSNGAYCSRVATFCRKNSCGQMHMYEVFIQ
jgi:hypothetical protein